MERERQHTRVYALGVIFLALIAIISMRFAVLEHRDRVLSEEIIWTASELQDTGSRITSIKDAKMRDMNEYIDAYSELTPLLDDYDRQLEKISALYRQANQRQKGLLRLERLYNRPIITNEKVMSEILEIARSLSKVMREEVSTIQSIATKPEAERLRLWHEQFLPLEAEEKGLRTRLVIVSQRLSPAEQ